MERTGKVEGRPVGVPLTISYQQFLYALDFCSFPLCHGLFWFFLKGLSFYCCFVFLKNDFSFYCCFLLFFKRIALYIVVLFWLLKGFSFLKALEETERIRRCMWAWSYGLGKMSVSIVVACQHHLSAEWILVLLIKRDNRISSRCSHFL